MRLFLLLPLILFSLACSRASVDESDEIEAEEEQLKEGYLFKIENEAFTDALFPYVLSLEHSKGLRPEFIFICYDFEVNKIRIILSSQQILEIKQARRWMVDIVEGLVDEVNSYPTLVDSHGGLPYDPNDLEIYVNFESFYGVYCDPTFVGTMVLNNGVIHYSAFGVKNPKLDKWGCRIERYALAKQLIDLEDAHNHKIADENKNIYAPPSTKAKERYLPGNPPRLPPRMGTTY